MTFFGLKVSQEDNGPIRVEGEEKSQGLSLAMVSQQCRKMSDETINSNEKFSSQSKSGSLGFLGSTLFPFESFAGRYLQQTGGPPCIQSLVRQIHVPKAVKKRGSTSTFIRPIVSVKFPIVVIVFADDARPNEKGHLGYLSGLVVGPIEKGSIFHVL